MKATISKIWGKSIAYWADVYVTIQLSNGEKIHGWISNPRYFHHLPLDDIEDHVRKHFKRKQPKAPKTDAFDWILSKHFDFPSLVDEPKKGSGIE